MTAAPFPIDRLPPAYQAPASTAALALANLVAVSAITDLELHWIREIITLRTLHDHRQQLLASASTSELLQRMEHAEKATADAQAEQGATLAAMDQLGRKLAEAEDRSDRANRRVAVLEEELRAIRGANPVA